MNDIPSKLTMCCRQVLTYHFPASYRREIVDAIWCLITSMVEGLTAEARLRLHAPEELCVGRSLFAFAGIWPTWIGTRGTKVAPTR